MWIWDVCVCINPSKVLLINILFLLLGLYFFINNIWLLLWVTFLYFFQLKNLLYVQGICQNWRHWSIFKTHKTFKNAFSSIISHWKCCFVCLLCFHQEKVRKKHFLLYCAFCELNNVSSFWGFPVYVSPVTCNSSEWMRKI